jgi:hypothetical protein
MGAWSGTSIRAVCRRSALRFEHALTVAVRELLEPGDDTGQIAYEINLH